MFNFKKKVKRKFYIIFLIIFLSAFFIVSKINIINLNKSEKKFFKGFNFQGIECIDNELFLISNHDSKIYKLQNDLNISLFFDTHMTYKNKQIFSHITSFFIKNDFFYGVNSMDKLNGIFLKTKLNNKIKLINTNYEFLNLTTNINHIEFNENQNITFFNQRNSDNKISFLEIKKNNEFQCKILNNIKIQNIYYDEIDKNVLLLSNLLFYKFGKIFYFSMEDICRKKLSFFSADKVDIIINPSYELEGFTKFNNNDYFVFIDKNNSYVYKK